MAREAALVRRTGAELDRRGAWWLNTHGSVMGRAGLPDIIAIHRGRGLVIETKAPSGRLRPLQRHVLAQAQKAGAIAVVARTLDDVKAALDQIEETP